MKRLEVPLFYFKKYCTNSNAKKMFEVLKD
jgi:hypothetical protein